MLRMVNRSLEFERLKAEPVKNFNKIIVKKDKRSFRSYNRAFLTPLFALIKTLREISDIPAKSLTNYFVL